MKVGTIGLCAGCGALTNATGPMVARTATPAFPGTAAHAHRAARNQAAPRPAPEAEPVPRQAEPDREPELSLF